MNRLSEMVLEGTATRRLLRGDDEEIGPASRRGPWSSAPYRSLMRGGSASPSNSPRSGSLPFQGQNRAYYLVNQVSYRCVPVAASGWSALKKLAEFVGHGISWFSNRWWCAAISRPHFSPLGVEKGSGIERASNLDSVRRRLPVSIIVCPGFLQPSRRIRVSTRLNVFSRVSITQKFRFFGSGLPLSSPRTAF